MFFFKNKYNNKKNNDNSDLILSKDKNHNRILFEFTFKIINELIEYFSKINSKFIEFNSIVLEKDKEKDEEKDKENLITNSNEDKGLRNNLNPRKDECKIFS